MSFAFEKAYDLKKEVVFTYKSVMDMYYYNKKNLMFYYIKDSKDVISFALFNRGLYCMEFNTYYAKDLRKEMPE